MDYKAGTLRGIFRTKELKGKNERGDYEIPAASVLQIESESPLENGDKKIVIDNVSVHPNEHDSYAPYIGGKVCVQGDTKATKTGTRFYYGGRAPFGNELPTKPTALKPAA